MIKTIYLNFLILLIATFVSSSYLYAENYPSGYTTSNAEAENDDSYQQQNSPIQTPYPGDSNQVAPSPSTQTLTAAQAANRALKERAEMVQAPVDAHTQTSQPTQIMPSPRREMPQLPPFVQSIQNEFPPTNQSLDLSSPALHTNLPYNQNVSTNKALPTSSKKCQVVCGQYSNYIYATLISSIAQSASVMGNEIMQKVTKFTRGQIQNKAQCTAEALTPHLSGKNTLYSTERFFPGMPKPQLFYRVCKKQCLSGKDGIIFKKSNPVIIEFMRQYDFTHGKKDDKTLAIIAASGNGGFEDEIATPYTK